MKATVLGYHDTLRVPRSSKKLHARRVIEKPRKVRFLNSEIETRLLRWRMLALLSLLIQRYAPMIVIA